MVLLFCYLGLYTWNARTGYLDTLAERSGLEIVGLILSPVDRIKDACAETWNKYVALIEVAEENTRLRSEVIRLERALYDAEEDHAELARLRRLFEISALRDHPGFGARIIGGRMGPQAVRQTVIIDKGYADGALVDAPVLAPSGVVGRIVRTAPHASTVLLVTDPEFRLAVIAGQSRTPGVLSGSTSARTGLEVAFVAQNAAIREGELLVTSGGDGRFPKGIPVGVVVGVQPGHETLFKQVHAEPLVSTDHLEEVIVLGPLDGIPLLHKPAPPFVGPPTRAQVEEAAAK